MDIEIRLPCQIRKSHNISIFELPPITYLQIYLENIPTEHKQFHEQSIPPSVQQSKIMTVSRVKASMWPEEHA